MLTMGDHVMTKRLENKIAVITGGNSGMGLAAAKLFQAEGAKVIITGRREETNNAARKEIGGAVIAFTSDSSKLDDITTLYENVKERYGKIDVLYLNAGIGRFSHFSEVEEATFDELVGVNFKGLFFNVQKALPLLSEGASVILTTSIAVQKGFPGTAIYSATKAAVRSLARTLAVELLDKNIRVNALAPGSIDTPIFENLGIPAEEAKQTKAYFESIIPMKRLGQVEEVAKPALFLASDDSTFMTGFELVADGGVTQL